jgi:hypothetical protein
MTLGPNDLVLHMPDKVKEQSPHFFVGTTFAATEFSDQNCIAVTIVQFDDV